MKIVFLKLLLQIPEINICEPSSESGKDTTSSSSNTAGEEFFSTENVGDRDLSSETVVGDRDSPEADTDKDFKVQV